MDLRPKQYPIPPGPYRVYDYPNEAYYPTIIASTKDIITSLQSQSEKPIIIMYGAHVRDYFNTAIASANEFTIAGKV